LVKYLAGIKLMEKLPDCIFVIDPRREHIPVVEGRKLGIPIVGIVDTNCDPDEVDIVIPGNDDAIRAIKLITGYLVDSIVEGLRDRENPARLSGHDKAQLMGGQPTPAPVVDTAPPAEPAEVAGMDEAPAPSEEQA